jgi:signal transduction histidine kinase
VTLSDCISLIASGGQLLLAVIALARPANNPLASALALLCVDVAGWTGASLAYELTHRAWFDWLDHALSPLTAPLAFDFVLVFVGARRAAHLSRLASWLLTGALSLATLAAFVVPAARPFVGSHAWATWLLAVAVPTMGAALHTLHAHLRRSSDVEEVARARTLLLAFGIGTALGLTESLGHFTPIPGMAPLGMLVAALGLSVVALRGRLFGHEVSPRALGASTAIVCVAVVGGAVGRRAFGAVAIFFVLAIAIATLAIVAAGKRRIAEAAARKERTAQLVTLGRFSAQMAHDLRNPLAALKGSAQLLGADLRRDTPAIDRLEFAELLLAQIGRMERICDRFGRLSRLELVRADVDVSAVVRGVLARQCAALPARVACETDLASELPRCDADGDMLANAIENVVRNALEAMPEGGQLTVRTSIQARARVEIAVKDTGVGMDARTRERAVDDFFTTKPHGSGLGLAFARRVLEAHGGALSIASEPGRGTLVRCTLPVTRPIEERAERA